MSAKIAKSCQRASKKPASNAASAKQPAAMASAPYTTAGRAPNLTVIRPNARLAATFASQNPATTLDRIEAGQPVERPSTAM